MKDKIGGPILEQDRFFSEVIATYPEQLWLDGCEAPCVKGTVISFELTPGAKTVARQPNPMSLFCELRTEYHLEEWMAQWKIRKLDTSRRGYQNGRHQFLSFTTKQKESSAGWFARRGKWLSAWSLRRSRPQTP